MRNSSFSLKNPQQKQVEASGDERALVPASTLKMLTGLRAIRAWGADYHFRTRFFLRGNNELIIVAGGDPYMTSEEIDAISKKLSGIIAQPINRVTFFDARFETSLKIDGRGDSLNPYDAIPGLLAANFNSINVRWDGARWVSAEAQTPLTPVAHALVTATGLKRSDRIAIHDANLGARYFCEILSNKLQYHGVKIAPDACHLATNTGLDGARLLYEHENSLALHEVLAGMMKYSNNFIANQLFLLLGGADNFHYSIEKAQQACQSFVSSEFGWDGSACVDGAGLSRNNRLSAQQLQQLLVSLRDYRDLFPEKWGGVFGKTGTLDGVRTLAGFIVPRLHPEDAWPFVVMLNGSNDYRLRETITRELQAIVEASYPR